MSEKTLAEIFEEMAPILRPCFVASSLPPPSGTRRLWDRMQDGRIRVTQLRRADESDVTSAGVWLEQDLERLPCVWLEPSDVPALREALALLELLGEAHKINERAAAREAERALARAEKGAPAPAAASPAATGEAG